MKNSNIVGHTFLENKIATRGKTMYFRTHAQFNILFSFLCTKSYLRILQSYYETLCKQGV